MECFQLSIDAFIDILSEMILCLIILQLYLKKIPTSTQALSLLDHCRCFTAGSDLGCPWIGSDVKTILTQKWLIISTEGALRLPMTYVSQNLSKFNILSVEQLITSIRAKFIHNLRIGRLPGEFKNFATMVDFNDQDVRQSRFSF